MSAPLMSFGLPVYNGADHVRRALECLLAQDYPELEIVVSDNASTDETPQVLAEFAARDPRVRVHRNSTNIGASRNFNRAFELARGKYFAWAGHDDLWEPSFARLCVARLEADRELAMAHPWARLIDLEGREYSFAAQGFLRGSPSPAERFRASVVDLWSPLGVYGVFRASTLRRTRLFRDVLAADRLLLSEVSLLGNFAEVESFLWTYRYTAVALGHAYQERMRRDLRGLGRAVSAVAPWGVLTANYLSLAATSDVSWPVRLQCSAIAARWFAVDASIIPMARSAIIATVGAARFEHMRHKLRSMDWYRALRDNP